MYEIEYSDRSMKFLKNLDKYISEIIIKRIELLKINPISSDVKFIGRNGGGEKIFRFRIGSEPLLESFKYLVMLYKNHGKREQTHFTRIKGDQIRFV